MMPTNTTALLVVTALLEIPTGIVLLLAPSMASALLLGGGLESPEAVVVGRVAGAALLSIGLMCWLGRNHDRDGLGSALVGGLLVYNAAAVVLLGAAAVVDKMHGIGLWPAVGLHAVLAVWCAAGLRRRPASVG